MYRGVAELRAAQFRSTEAAPEDEEKQYLQAARWLQEASCAADCVVDFEDWRQWKDLAVEGAVRAASRKLKTAAPQSKQGVESFVPKIPHSDQKT